MMKFKNNNTFEPVVGASVEYLKSLGITEIESFLYKPKPRDYESPWHLGNIDKLIDTLHEDFEQNKHFFIQVDSDTDGMTSAAIFYNYFTMLYPAAEIAYRIHDGKKHGVIVDTIPVDTDVVIIPDAGTNQIEEQYAISESGRQVLIMDHHNADEELPLIPNVIIVNNQISTYFNNKELSGAGVVFKVIQAYDERYGKKILYKRFEDLAALGIIADMMDVRTLDNNAIIMNGLSNIHNNLFKALLKKQEYHIQNIENPNKIDVAFYIAPLINAVIRSGSVEEKTKFFEGFINHGSEERIVTISRGHEREETLFEYLARTAINLKATQNRQKDKAMAALYDKIDKQHLADNKILVVNTDGLNVPFNITGLAAMELNVKYNRPTLLLRPVEEDGKTYYRGSGRAAKVEGFYDFQHTLLESGMMDYCQGHDNAFGASIEKTKVNDLVNWFNDKLSNVDFTPCSIVDCVIEEKTMNPLVLKEFGEMKNVFGNGIPQPKFYFNFTIGINDARIQGANMDSLKISSKGVTFVMFKNKDLCNQWEKLQEQIEQIGGRVRVEIIGRSEINEWQGYKNVQIMVDKIEMNWEEKLSLF